jgi:hypothetical protein
MLNDSTALYARAGWAQSKLEASVNGDPKVTVTMLVPARALRPELVLAASRRVRPWTTPKK